MLKIYVFGSLPPFAVGLSRDLRALWAAEECGLDYRVKPLDAMSGEHRNPDYLDVNPFGKLPAIEDEGLRLFESGAVLLYMAEKAGTLMPADASGRALAHQWLCAALNTIEPALMEPAAIELFHPEENWARERRAGAIAAAQEPLAVAEREITDRPYLLGESFSVVDILMAHILRLAERLTLLDDYPALTAYKARCEARPAWHRVLADYEHRLAA